VNIDSIKPRVHPLTEANAIHRTRDEQGDIVVYDIDRRRVLAFGSIFEQSSIDLDDPARLIHEYTQAMLLPLLAIEPAHVTLLGLGGGSLVHALLQALPAAQLDIVELRQAVIDVAYTHFLLPRNERVRVHCADARQYVGNGEEASTDLLLCDLYAVSEANTIQLDKAFCRRCKLLLNPDGWLVANYHQLPNIEHPAIRTLCSHFASVFLCMVSSGNWVLLASDAPLAQEGDCWQHVYQRQPPLMRRLAFHGHRSIRIE
jgi:spermidine synthase